MATLTKHPEPIQTVYLHVRSKDADQRTPGLNTDLCIDLKRAIRAKQNEVIDVTMISASIPHSFYSISSYIGNDTIVYDTNQTLTLDTQNYDPWELVRVINADTAFNAIFTASYNIYTNKMTFTNTTGANHDLNWTSSGANNPLGYQYTPDETVPGGASSSSTDMIDLATIHSIVVRSDMAQGNVITTNSGGLTVLQIINVNVDPLSLIYLDATDVSTVTLSHAPSIDRICFRLEDQNGKLIDLNNRNYEFSIVFHIHQLVPNTALITNLPPVLPSPVQTVPLIRNTAQTIGEALSGQNAFLPSAQEQVIQSVINNTILDSLLE